MLVLQQVNVLPKGSVIIIYDGSDIVLQFKKSIADDSLLFSSTENAERYYKVYSTYKVHGLKAYIFNPSISFCNAKQEIIYQIQIREGFENESEGCDSAST